MKWILAILLFVSGTAIGQSDDTDKYIWYKYQYGSRMPRFWADSVLKAAGLVKFTGLAASVDTTTYKPIAINSSGNVVKLSGWPGSGISDTTNKWMNDLRRRSGTDTVEKFKNGSWQFAYKDSTGGGGSIDTMAIRNDSLFTNSNTQKVPIPFLSFRNRRVGVQVDTLFATSTSFGTSYNLTNSDKGNFQILADRLKMTLLNHSMGGLDIQAACVEVSANIRPGVNKYMQVNAVGYNLLRYAGDNDSAYKQLQDGLRSIIATNLIDTIFYGDNARITQHGTWGTSTYASYGGKSGAFGGNGLYSNSNNDSLKIQITGDAIIVGYLNQVASGGESGTFNIYVDNVLRKTINAKNACGVSDGTYSNQTTAGAVLLDGLGAGIHTVKIVNTQAKYLYFDYIATTKATNECAPVIISLIPKMTAAGYAVSPANASDAIFNKGDSVIMVAVNEFSNYPVTVSYPNDYFNPTTMTQGDNVHPDEAGQAAIAHANSIQIFTAEKIPAGSTSQWSNTSGGIYFPSGNVGIGATATSPATALQLKSSAPAFRIDDTNGSNAAFYSNYTDFAQLAINRNPSTGVFTNSGKAAAQISLKADAGEGSIFFYTTNTNNTSPTQQVILDGLGNWGFGNIVSPTARLHLPGVTTSAGTAPIKLASGTLMTTIENGAIENDGAHLYYSAGGTRYQLDQQGGADGNGIYSGSNSLSGPTTITGAGNALTLTGTQAAAAAFTISNTGNGQALATSASGSGISLSSNNSGSGTSIFGSANSGVGGYFTSTSGLPLYAAANPSSTNSIVNTFMTGRSTSSTAAAGLGTSWDMQNEDDAGNLLTTFSQRSVLTSAATGAVSADYQIWTINSGSLAQKFTIKPAGQMKFNTYGSGTHTGTVVSFLATTSDGSVIETSTATGSIVVMNDADHTVTGTESAIRYHNTITGNRTVTIPDPSAATNREIWIKWNTINGGSSLNITTTTGTALIYLDGTASSATYNITTSNRCFLLKSDGTSWYSVGGSN